MSDKFNLRLNMEKKIHKRHLIGHVRHFIDVLETNLYLKTYLLDKVWGIMSGNMFLSFILDNLFFPSMAIISTIQVG